MAGKKKQEKIGDALLKVALGYRLEEITEEYAEVDGKFKLTRRKETKKDIPPDLKAVQLLLASDSEDLSSMSEEQLERERQRLLDELKSSEDKKRAGTKSKPETPPVSKGKNGDGREPTAAVEKSRSGDTEEKGKIEGGGEPTETVEKNESGDTEEKGRNGGGREVSAVVEKHGDGDTEEKGKNGDGGEPTAADDKSREGDTEEKEKNKGGNIEEKEKEKGGEAQKAGTEERGTKGTVKKSSKTAKSAPKRRTARRAAKRRRAVKKKEREKQEDTKI